jgi:PAS domain S-box-containing protein
MRRVGPAKVYYLSHQIPISALLNYTTNGFIVFNEEGKIVQINDSALTIMGVEREDIVGKDLTVNSSLTNIHSEIVEYMKEKNQNDISSEQIIEYEGDTRVFNIQIIRTSFETGQSGFTLILDDITENKKNEKRIFESEKQYENLFNSLKLGVILIDPDGTPHKINPEAQKIFDMKFDSVNKVITRGKKFERITINGNIMKPTEMAGPRARDTKKRIDNVLMGLKWEDDNTTWLNVSAEPIFDDNEIDKILAFYEDITDKIRGSKIISKLIRARHPEQ